MCYILHYQVVCFFLFAHSFNFEQSYAQSYYRSIRSWVGVDTYFGVVYSKDLISQSEISLLSDLYCAWGLIHILEQQQHKANIELNQANVTLNKSNSRLVLLSILLAVIPMISGIMSYFQIEESNQLMDKQLNQFETIINQLNNPVNSSPFFEPLEESNPTEINSDPEAHKENPDSLLLVKKGIEF